MKLVIAEKPALAQAINDAISPNSTRKDGYFENGDYCITWCIGHLLEIIIPADNDKFWSFDNLPVEIDSWKFQVKNDVKSQYNIIKDLLSKTDEVIHAGDPDEEGQLIVDSILYREGVIDLQGNTRKNIKRLLVNDFNTDAIKKELNNLKNNNDFLNLSYEALARSLADKAFGYNMSRAYTIKNKQSGNTNVISIGRVQTPMLGLIYRREEEVKNHVKKDYYEIFSKVKINSNILTFKYQIKEDEYEDDKKIINIDTANSILTRLEKSNFKVKEFSKKEEVENVPLPFNLLDLQQICSKRFGYKPEEVMQITQSLREDFKAITYNRSDCNYLLDESYQEAPDLINTLSKIDDNNISNLISNTNTDIKSKCFDSSKTSAHTAIIPTNTTVEMLKMTNKQKNVYLLIVERYLMQFLPPAKYEKSTIILSNDSNDELKYSQRICIDQGFKSIIKNEDNKEDEATSSAENINISENQEINDLSFEVLTLQTKPKKLYTMDTFLGDLKSVAKYAKDKKIRDILKEKDKDKAGENGGIGTPATRSSIIERLYNKNFIKDDKKNIVTTDLGKEFIKMVSEEISYPDMTALWHEEIKEIGTDMNKLKSFLDSVTEFSKKEIESAKENVNFKSNAVKCPNCETGHLIRKKSTYGTFYSCSNYPECKTTFQDNKGKPDIYEKIECPVCKKSTIDKKNGKNGIYWKCKECDTTFKDNKGKPDLALKEKPTPSEKYRCLECNSKLVLRNGKNGSFWGCSNYPTCKQTYKDNSGEPIYNNKITQN